MDFLEQERDLLGAVVCFLRADLGESCAAVKSQRARIGRSQVYFATQALSPAESNSGEVLVERFGDPLASCTRRNGDAIHIGEILVMIAKPLKVRTVIFGVGGKTDQEGQDLLFFVADKPEISGFDEKALHAGHVEAIDVGHHRLVESQHLNKVRGSCIANRIGHYTSMNVKQPWLKGPALHLAHKKEYKPTSQLLNPVMIILAFITYQ